MPQRPDPDSSPVMVPVGERHAATVQAIFDEAIRLGRQRNRKRHGEREMMVDVMDAARKIFTDKAIKAICGNKKKG